jgi:hypothetical protein
MFMMETVYVHLYSQSSGKCMNGQVRLVSVGTCLSPVLGCSGLMYKEGYSVRRVPEVIARSGSALLHFYSDVAYNMTGFNISYRYFVMQASGVVNVVKLCLIVSSLHVSTCTQ